MEGTPDLANTTAGAPRRTSPSAKELLLVAAGLAAVGAVVFGPHIAKGGFYSDDWSNASDYHYAKPPRFIHAGNPFSKSLGGRPVIAYLLDVPYALFGAHPAAHLALAAALGIATALCVHLALRTIGLPAVEAGGVALLVLLFPWSDSERLWPAASINNVAVCFFLVGLTVALRAIRAQGRRSAVLHGVAVLLYLLSVLTYQTAAVGIMLAGLLYLLEAPWRTAVRRWAIEIVVVLSALVYSLFSTVATQSVGGGLGQRISDIPVFARENLKLVAFAVVPVGTYGKLAQTAILASLAFVIALAVWRSTRAWLIRGEERRPAVPRSLLMLAAAVAVIGAADVMLLGSFLHPLDPGIDNRANVFAAVGFCLLVAAIAGCIARLLTNNERWASRFAAGLVALIAVIYAGRVRDDASRWDEAARRQRVVLEAVLAHSSELRSGASVLSFGYPADVTPRIPIFDETWDLTGALRLKARQRDLLAYPIYEGVDVMCERDGLTIHGPGSYSDWAVDYGDALFVDVTSGRAQRIDDREACGVALRQFRPGPAVVNDERAG